ncbi:MAG: iron-sulfur cluster loop [Candidatus Poribacteria bacterium]|jgi:endonuclease III|nr:iron-sulfur cluster loop [Candidatus Poribacteria bacterium]
MVNLLIQIAKERFEEPTSQLVHFVDDENANAILNDLDKYPHAYVLACLMDRQIKAERAWGIPYEICKELNSFEFCELEKLDLEDLKNIFSRKKLHRFNEIMSEIFYGAIVDIRDKYDGNAANIWSNTPSSAAVVYRFLEFKGCGIKISTMAANILARQFRIPYSDYYSIDISPDVHIIRVMKRMGFVPKNADSAMVIYKARELNPEFPGIIDFSCWEIGRNWCKPKIPICSECIVKNGCDKVF